MEHFFGTLSKKMNESRSQENFGSQYHFESYYFRSELR